MLSMLNALGFRFESHLADFVFFFSFNFTFFRLTFYVYELVLGLGYDSVRLLWVMLGLG